MTEMLNRHQTWRAGKVLTILLVLALAIAAAVTWCALDRTERVDTWESERRLAFEKYRDSKFDDSIRHYLKATELAKQLGKNDFRLALTSKELARAYLAEENYNQAITIFKQSIDLIEATAGAGLRQHQFQSAPAATLDCLVDALEGVAVASGKVGHNVEADSYFKQALEILEVSNQPTKKQLVVLEYRDFLTKQGRTPEAKDLEKLENTMSTETPLPELEDNLREQYRKALQSADNDEAAKDLHAEVADCKRALNLGKRLQDAVCLGDAATRLARCYARLNMLVPSERWFTTAFRAYDAGRPNDVRMVNCLHWYSETLAAEGRWPQAEEAIKRAMAIADKKGPDAELLKSELIDKLVEFDIHEKKWDQVITMQRQRYEQVRKTASLFSSSAIVQTEYLANVYFMANRKSNAKKILAEYEKQALKTPNFRQNPQSLLIAARLFTDFGIVCLRSLGRPDEAECFFRASLSLLKHIPKEQIETQRTRNILQEAFAAQRSSPASKSH